MSQRNDQKEDLISDEDIPSSQEIIVEDKEVVLEVWNPKTKTSETVAVADPSLEKRHPQKDIVVGEKKNNSSDTDK